MSNFKFLLSEPGFASFADVAIVAEKRWADNPGELRKTGIAEKSFMQKDFR